MINSTRSKKVIHDSRDTMRFGLGDNFTVRQYWNRGYQYIPDILENQTMEIANSWIDSLPGTQTERVLREAKTVFDVACGPGHISNVIDLNFACGVVGSDISAEAVKIAEEYFASDKCKFIARDMRAIKQQCEVVMSANVIEHYKDPHGLIDAYLKIASHVIIITPWAEPNIHNIHEGCGWHLQIFNDGDFDRHNIIEEWKFESPGWKKGDSRQWNILIGRSV